ncbi:MAG: hypothetical protein BRC29_03485 [Nanohaloarchaea archaeon SW_7_43_1]|nr:MAG: hypothetical protein BRC29_03485 [Nanohaloarchaea archaeon SW_7_43_1]
MDREEKSLQYQVMMKEASTSLNLVAIGSVSSLVIGLGVGVLKDPWMGFSIFSVAWYLKGWSFRKMAQETGRVCPECGGSVFR